MQPSVFFLRGFLQEKRGFAPNRRRIAHHPGMYNISGKDVMQMPQEETRRWERYNANPTRERVGDCVVRAIAVLMGKNWDTIYIDLCVQGLLMGDMPTANHVWGSYLRAQGYKRAMLGDDCTVQQFAEENRSGKYILAMPAHVVAIVEGKYIDTWDCGDEVPVYFWRKEEDKA